MSFTLRAAVLLMLAGIAGAAGVPILAAAFAVAGLVLLDGVMIGAILRFLLRRKRE